MTAQNTPVYRRLSVTEKRGPSQPSKDDRYTLKRYSEFHTAATYVARAFAAMPCVKRIALFGSIAATPTSEHDRRGRRRIHIPKDVDLAVWVDDTGGLDRLRVLCGRALNRLLSEAGIGVAHHQVDVFLLDPKNEYLGRLCHFNECPKHKPQCRAEGCGKILFLQQHDDFVFNSGRSLHQDRLEILYHRDTDHRDGI